MQCKAQRGLALAWEHNLVKGSVNCQFALLPAIAAQKNIAN